MNDPTAGVPWRAPRVHQFISGDWRIVPGEGAIVCGSKRVRLGRQQMDLLLLLLSNPDRAVSRDEIFAAVWGGVTVEPGALARCISELRKSLEDDARDPRYIRTLPKRGYQWVAPLESPAGGGTDPPQVRRRWIRIAKLTAAALLLVVLGWVATGQFNVAGREQQKSVIAVIGFSDPSGRPEHAWIGTALAELLSTDLAQTRYRVIPGETVARLKQELSIPATDSFAAETLSRVRAAVGADYIVSGSYVAQPSGQELRVDVKVQDTASGETLAAVIERGTVDDVLGLISRAGVQLRTVLGSETDQRIEFAPHLTRDPEATRAYFEGLMYLRQLNAPAARDKLLFVVERVPDHPFARIALAEAWAALGYRERAVEQAERGLAVATSLPREQQLWLEARMLEVSQRQAEAIELYRALWVFAPHNTDYALRLAGQQAKEGDPGQALKTLERVNEGREHRDPRLDLVEAHAARRLADHRRAVAAATRAEALGGELGARWVVAHARHARALSLYALGHADEAMEAIERARQAFHGSGRLRDEAATNRVLGGWLANHGEFARSLEALNAALDGYRSAGDRAGEASVLPRIADLLAETGDLAPARQRLDWALDTYREIGDRAGEAGVLNRLGVTLAKHRDYAGAREAFVGSLALHREIGNRELAAVGLMNLGKLDLLNARPEEALAKLREADRDLAALDLKSRLATVRFNLGYAEQGTGRHTEASRTFESTVALYRELKNPRMLAASLNALGEALVEQQRPDAAESSLREGLEIRIEIGEPTRIAESRVALSACLLAQDRVDEALDVAYAAVDGSKERDGELLALAAVVDALLEKRLSKEAEDVVDRAAELWTEDRLESERDLVFAISAARVRSHRGQFEAAVHLLDDVLARTSSRRAWRLYSAAALARCEVEELSGAGDSAESCVRELESAAHSTRLVAVASTSAAASGER